MSLPESSLIGRILQESEDSSLAAAAATTKDAKKQVADAPATIVLPTTTKRVTPVQNVLHGLSQAADEAEGVVNNNNGVVGSSSAAHHHQANGAEGEAEGTMVAAGGKASSTATGEASSTSGGEGSTAVPTNSNRRSFLLRGAAGGGGGAAGGGSSQAPGPIQRSTSAPPQLHEEIAASAGGGEGLVDSNEPGGNGGHHSHTNSQSSQAGGGNSNNADGNAGAAEEFVLVNGEKVPANDPRFTLEYYNYYFSQKPLDPRLPHPLGNWGNWHPRHSTAALKQPHAPLNLASATPTTPSTSTFPPQLVVSDSPQLGSVELGSSLGDIPTLASLPSSLPNDVSNASLDTLSAASSPPFHPNSFGADDLDRTLTAMSLGAATDFSQFSQMQTPISPMLNPYAANTSPYFAPAQPPPDFNNQAALAAAAAYFTQQQVAQQQQYNAAAAYRGAVPPPANVFAMLTYQQLLAQAAANANTYNPGNRGSFSALPGVPAPVPNQPLLTMQPNPADLQAAAMAMFQQQQQQRGPQAPNFAADPFRNQATSFAPNPIPHRGSFNAPPPHQGGFAPGQHPPPHLQQQQQVFAASPGRQQQAQHQGNMGAGGHNRRGQHHQQQQSPSLIPLVVPPSPQVLPLNLPHASAVPFAHLNAPPPAQPTLQTQNSHPPMHMQGGHRGSRNHGQNVNAGGVFQGQPPHIQHLHHGGQSSNSAHGIPLLGPASHYSASPSHYIPLNGPHPPAAHASASQPHQISPAAQAFLEELRQAKTAAAVSSSSATTSAAPTPTASASDSGTTASSSASTDSSSSTVTSAPTSPSSSVNYTLHDVIQRNILLDLAMDQHGSRFIQQRLEQADEKEKNAVFAVFLQDILRLSHDVFGNYCIQKCLDYANASQKKQFCEALQGNVLMLSLQMYGCRVIQKCLEVTRDASELQSALVQELTGHILQCVRDQNGNHVIQKCIECIPSAMIAASIIDVFQHQIYALSIHPYGCRVIQRLLEHSSEQNRKYILDEIIENVDELCRNQYGNYVIQHILKHGSQWHKSAILAVITGIPANTSSADSTSSTTANTVSKAGPSKVLQLAKHKFASNVIEKCFQNAGPKERRDLMDQILGPDNLPMAVADAATTSASTSNNPLLEVAKDPYGNFVLQKLIDEANADERQVIITRVVKQGPNLRKIPYGKHIIAKIEKIAGKSFAQCEEEFANGNLNGAAADVATS